LAGRKIAVEKVCRICGATKPPHEFYPNRGYSDGRDSACKACRRHMMAQSQMRPPKNPPPNGMKRCGLCKEIKLTSMFTRNKNFYDGLADRCKSCNNTRSAAYAKANRARLSADEARRYRENPQRYREYERKKRYGIPHGTYDKMLTEQAGRCAICGTDNPAPRRHFSVDHNHNTGIVRGLLCNACNTGIGHLKHSTTILLAAVRYLQDLPVSSRV
jgi:hypothetical protein